MVITKSELKLTIPSIGNCLFFYNPKVYYETPKGSPQYLNRTVERKRFRYTMNRPWTGQFRQQNMPGTMRKKVFVTPIGKYINNLFTSIKY